MKALEILTRVSEVASDYENVTYTKPQVIGWINDAIRALIVKRPDALVELRAVKLQPGTKQFLPDDAHKLLGVIRNMGIDGDTPGKAIRGPVSQEELDAYDPDWHNAATGRSVDEYIYNITNPLNFYVIPPMDERSLDVSSESIVAISSSGDVILSDAHNLIVGDKVNISGTGTAYDGDHTVTNIITSSIFKVDAAIAVGAINSGQVGKYLVLSEHVELRIGLLHAVISNETEDIPVIDLYAPALIDWCLYRLFARDSEKTPNRIRATSHYQSFMQLVDGKTQMDSVTEPKVTENL